MELIILGFMLYVGWIFVNVLIAQAKGYPPGVGFASVIATPVLVYLYLLAVPPKTPKTSQTLSSHTTRSV